MALPDEFFGQPGNDPFRAAIELGRNAFHQRCDLRDFHFPGACGSYIE
jgi:hypothetical protein